MRLQRAAGPQVCAFGALRVRLFLLRSSRRFLIVNRPLRHRRAILLSQKVRAGSLSIFIVNRVTQAPSSRRKRFAPVPHCPLSIVHCPLRHAGPILPSQKVRAGSSLSIVHCVTQAPSSRRKRFAPVPHCPLSIVHCPLRHAAMAGRRGASATESRFCPLCSRACAPMLTSTPAIMRKETSAVPP